MVKKKLRITGRATRAAQVFELWNSAVASLAQSRMSDRESIVGRMMLKTSSWKRMNKFSKLKKRTGYYIKLQTSCIL